jgi:hypothetical protein
VEGIEVISSAPGTHRRVLLRRQRSNYLLIYFILTSYHNRLIEGNGVRSAPQYRDKVGQRLATEGYLGAMEASD